ncbi:MAG: 50S ribosomal protein L3 [Nanoarchaeota archaeon]
MAKLSRPRRGSLQYWPRKRVKEILPSVNWTQIVLKNNDKKLLGFIGYKVGMLSAYVKDNTSESMTKNKRVVVPVTIIECPPVKIFSTRFYKNNNLVTEILSSNLDKELKRVVKLPKNDVKKLEDVKHETYDDIQIIVYSIVKKTGLKKKPDMIEVGLGGNVHDKINFVKENLNKEIKISDIFSPMQLVDVRGVTKGKGLEGAVRRHGIGLRSHKAEKGRRRAGSLGPWHPARVTFRVPQAGQLGMFTRATYNLKIIGLNSIEQNNINPSGGFKHFGNIHTDYLLLGGSVQGPQKRALIITFPLRKTKKQDKKNYEFIELR